MTEAERFVRSIYPTVYARNISRINPNATRPWWDIVYPSGVHLNYLGWGCSKQTAWNAAKRYIENQMIIELSN